MRGDAEELGLPELTDEDVQRMYQTVYFLHHDPEKVRCVIQEAVEWSQTIHARQERRPDTPQPVRARAESFLALLQLSLFEVSVQRWKPDLAQGTHQKTPAAQPDAPTLLTQYLAHLAWHGIRHDDSIYMAVSEGCLLYRYSPLQVCTVFALPLENRGRIKRRLQRWLEASFTHVAILDDGAFVTRSPTACERQQIQQALTLFTPWGSNCISPDVFRSLALPRAFDDATLSEQDRKHALMHANCAGIERLVCEWNRQYPEERLDDPDTTLEVPMFRNSGPPAPEDFDEDGPPPLSDRGLRELRGHMAYWLQRAQRRRRANAFHRLRVCVDGQEQLSFAPGARALPLTVPLSAIRIQVFGHDAEGELPLALFYLPDLEEVGDTQCLYAVLDGGATIELVLSPVRGKGGEVTAGRVDMHFWADEAQVPIRDRAEDVPSGGLSTPEAAVFGTELSAQPVLRWYGASTKLLTDFVRLDRMAASSEAGAMGGRLVHLEEGRVIATVRLTADGQLAVALETQDPQCAERQWGFRVTREDGTEFYRAAIALQLCTEQPGLWEGRVEVPLIFPEGCGFEFYSLPNDIGNML